MPSRLRDQITNDYLDAAQRLNSRYQRRKIVAYVEGFEDVFFWRSLLNEVETDEYYFEVMLPSRSSLQKGKKVALMNALSSGLGPNLIVCVDADYDYLLQGVNGVSRMLCKNPYVFHTYVYAIENFQCYAPTLHTVCVMSTLNDHVIFDFEAFLTAYSKIVFPLFVWSIWCYRYGYFKTFSMQDLCYVVELNNVNLHNPNATLDYLRRRVNSKISWLQHHLEDAKMHYKDVENTLLALGVRPDNTYLFMRGHDIFDKVVYPLVNSVCQVLTVEREQEIRRLAYHSTQRTNELSSYEHISSNVDEMMKKQTDYHRAELYKRIQKDIQELLAMKNNYPPNEPVWDKNEWKERENM